jgi:hypothetical protein
MIRALPSLDDEAKDDILGRNAVERLFRTATPPQAT